MGKEKSKTMWKMQRGKTDGMDRRKWMNGNKQGDEEGEWTYIGSRREIVIDYETVNEEAWERVEEFKIGEREQSRSISK
jgi:hypothetical protein